MFTPLQSPSRPRTRPPKRPALDKATPPRSPRTSPPLSPKMTEALEQLRQSLRDKVSFGDLPSDIVLQINDQLPDASSLSLAATCKGLRRLLHPVIKQAPIFAWEAFHEDSTARERRVRKWKEDCASRVEFLEYLRRDALTRAIRFERSGEDQLLRACSFCVKLHPSVAFSATELIQPPETRKCLGHTVRFQFCDHIDLPWSFPRPNEWYKQSLRCESCKHLGFSYWSRTRLGHGSITISSTVLVVPSRELEPVDTIHGNDIRNKLDALRHKVCPHTVATSGHFPSIENMVFSTSLSSFLHPDVPRQWCTHPDCVTQFSLNISMGDFPVVFLKIDRDVGSMEDVFDPTWMAQCGVSSLFSRDENLEDCARSKEPEEPREQTQEQKEGTEDIPEGTDTAPRAPKFSWRETLRHGWQIGESVFR